MVEEVVRGFTQVVIPQYKNTPLQVKAMGPHQRHTYSIYIIGILLLMHFCMQQCCQGQATVQYFPMECNGVEV